MTILERHVSMIVDQLLAHDRFDVVLVGDTLHLLTDESHSDWVQAVVDAIGDAMPAVVSELLERDRIISARLAEALGDDAPRPWMEGR